MIGVATNKLLRLTTNDETESLRVRRSSAR